MLNKKDEGMKFDVVIGNPPYQAPNGVNNVLWDKFVGKSFDITNIDGFVCLIHPSRWRKPNDKTGQTILSHQIHYLEIHNEKDGMKTFNAETRYDIYVAQNKSPFKNAFVVDQDGIKTNIPLHNLPFIPNANIKKIMALIAKRPSDMIQVIANSSYHTQRDHISKEKIGKFKYPCIYTVNSKGETRLVFSSRNDKGHFNIPKLVFSRGRISSANYFIDSKGDYGLTEFSYGIVDSPKNLQHIYNAMRTAKFKNLMESCSMSMLQIDQHIMKLFRKDFWKEFVDEGGSEI